MEAGEKKDSPNELLEILIAKIAAAFGIKALEKLRKSIEADEAK